MATQRETNRLAKRKLLATLRGRAKCLYRKGLRAKDIAYRTGLTIWAVKQIRRDNNLRLSPSPGRRSDAPTPRQPTKQKRYVRPDVKNADLLRDWLAGVGYHELCLQYGISYRTVYKRLREARKAAGSPERHAGYRFLSARQKGKIRSLPNQPATELARLVGVSPSTVRRVRKKFGKPKKTA